MVPMATFVRGKADITAESKKDSVAYWSKDPMDTREMYNEAGESLPSSSKFGIEKSLNKK